MSESLARSRHKWISEGLFEKFWAKPHKRKGVLQEDPKNPPKDSMMKVGLVTITIEPHIVEATMYAVKTSISNRDFNHCPDHHQPRDKPLQASLRSRQQLKRSNHLHHSNNCRHRRANRRLKRRQTLRSSRNRFLRGLFFNMVLPMEL
jgi:hypothetical protein